MEEVTRWLEEEHPHKALYVGLVQDHNSKWCQDFNKEETAYKKMLKELITELDKTMKGITEESLSGELAISTADIVSTWEQDVLKKK